MSKEQVLGIIRHGLTFIGGVLVTKGLVDEGTWAEVVGSALTLTGLIWSVIVKKTN